MVRLCASVFVWFQGGMVLRWWWVSISSHISYRISINVCAFSLYFVFLVLFWLLDAGYKAKALRIAISTDTSHIAQSKTTTKNNFDRYCLKSFWTCISIWYHLQWTGWFLFFLSLTQSLILRCGSLSFLLVFLLLLLLVLVFTTKTKNPFHYDWVFSFPFRCWHNDSLYSKSPAFFVRCYFFFILFILFSSGSGNIHALNEMATKEIETTVNDWQKREKHPSAHTHSHAKYASVCARITCRNFIVVIQYYFG